MSDDDYYSPHICLMAKGEKVKPKSKSKPPPPSDISSSELSDSSSDDEPSDEEIDNVIKNLDSKTKLFISKLMEDLESVQAELATRDDDLIAQENIYIVSKEALVLERSEVASLRKALAKEQEDHALTKKANIALNQKCCDLDEKHKELGHQYSLLWESTLQPSNANDISTPSTSQGCGKYYNLDLNLYSTNLANMETIKREISRLNAMLGKRCMEGKKAASGKDDQPKKAQYKNGRHPHIKDGLEHTKGAKTNGRKVINGYECVQFMSKGKIGIDQPAQMVAQKQPRAAQPAKCGSATVKGGSAAPHRKGKATSLSSAHVKPKKEVSKSKQEPRN
jgi:hypothetical protein